MQDLKIKNKYNKKKKTNRKALSISVRAHSLSKYIYKLCKKSTVNDII